MTKINNWPLQRDEDGQPFTATFGPDEFETWWLAGMDETDPIDNDAREQMLGAMLYIAEAEGRVMTQTIAELKVAIDDWANDRIIANMREAIDDWVNHWNDNVARLTRAVEEEG